MLTGPEPTHDTLGAMPIKTKKAPPPKPPKRVSLTDEERSKLNARGRMNWRPHLAALAQVNELCEELHMSAADLLERLVAEEHARVFAARGSISMSDLVERAFDKKRTK